jgi:hypothetical protein
LDEARASAARSSEKIRAGGNALRQQLSGRTREAARELQERAQELASEEKKIADALGSQRKGPSRLSEAGVGKEVEAQRKRLKILQEEMQRAAEATEVSEPLFSKALQDAHRSVVQNQIELKLKVVEDALAARREEVARRAEKSASDDVLALARAVEKAADEVLGDDAQALRQARAAVEKIARELSEKSVIAMSGQTSLSRDRDAAEHQNAEGKENTQEKKIGVNSESGSEGNKAATAGGSESRGAGVSQSPLGERQESGAPSEKAGSDAKGGQPRNDSKSGLANPTPRQGSDRNAVQPTSGNNAKVGGGEMQGTRQAPSNSALAGGSKETAGTRGQDPRVANEPSQAGTVSSAGGNSAQKGAANALGAGYAGGWGVPVQDLGEWLNRLDRVDALLERPQLRAGVARVQQAAEDLRAEMKRNASKPSQHQIQQSLMAPLTELRDAISAELARREGRDNEAPVDRDPVPRKYEASVRRYYEALGGGK